ncbi:hypothetical protein GCM10018966_096350 [Streptomyces yanii]
MNTPSRPNRPHVLFLMDDEHRADAAGYAGDPVARTPVLDELARTGVVFTNAYTAAPICIPARQSLAAGQFPHTTGCERYGEDLPPGHMTFARRFAQYGYQTVACGKLHHAGVDQMQGWLRRYGADIAMDPGLVPGRVEPMPVPMDLKWPQDKEVRRAGPGRASHEIDDEYAVQGALDYLDRHFVDSGYDRALPDTPLLLKVSLNQPHYPYIPARADRFDYYLNRVAPYTGQSLFDHPFLGGACRVRAGEEVSERDLRRATAAYYAMVETTDERFGRVLDAIRHAARTPTAGSSSTPATTARCSVSTVSSRSRGSSRAVCGCRSSCAGPAGSRPARWTETSASAIYLRRCASWPASTCRSASTAAVSYRSCPVTTRAGTTRRSQSSRPGT